MEWPNDLVLEFISFFEDEPAIWNPKHPNHKNRNEVHDSWKRIESKMGFKFSVSDLKKKKDSLMASYRTCSRKVKDSSKSGAGSSEVYRPNWFAFQFMDQFLRDKNLPRETLSSEEAPPARNEEFEGESSVDTSREPSPSPSTSREEMEQGNEAIVLPSTSTFKQPPRKKSRNSEEVDIRKKMDSAFSALQSLRQKKDRSVCDIYGELVAAKLKAMDEPTREVCMHRIDNILFEMRMLSKESSATKQPSNSPSPCPDDMVTLVTLSDASEAIDETVLICTDADNSEWSS